MDIIREDCIYARQSVDRKDSIWDGFRPIGQVWFFIKSQRAFCVLFCEWKEGTIIASDSHLRGDTIQRKKRANAWMK